MKISNLGFKSVQVKFDEKHSVPHQIFYKQHNIREESSDRPPDLTLFVCNIPPYYDEDCLKRIFKHCGIVQSVHFASVDCPIQIHSKRKPASFAQTPEIEGYKVAYVVFTSAHGLQNALDWKSSEPVLISNDEFYCTVGLKKWCREYNDSFVVAVNMNEAIAGFMSNYDEKVKNEEVSQKEKGEPNEEGWVTVSKRGRNPGFSRKQSVKNNLMKAVQRRKQKKTLLNFYTFQIRESKMNHLIKLREKFEDDKKKIETLKSRRKFKPF